MLTRRHFISALAAATALGSLGVAALVGMKRRLGLAELRPAVLSGLQDTSVDLFTADGRIHSARVVRVDSVRRPARGTAPATEQTSVQLAAADRAIPSGCYRLESDTTNFGALDFVAVGRAGADRRLEAVITRIV